MTDTLEQVITEITAAGFLINNLFQCDMKHWQANLRSPAGHTNFAIADTPAAALESCLLLLNDLVAPIARPGGFHLEGPRPSLSDLIRKPSSPINRRF